MTININPTGRGGNKSCNGADREAGGAGGNLQHTGDIISQRFFIQFDL